MGRGKGRGRAKTGSGWAFSPEDLAATSSWPRHPGRHRACEVTLIRDPLKDKMDGFRVKPGMTWVWGWVGVYGLFSPDWIPGRARNDA